MKKKIIVLSIVILFVLLCTLGVGLYARNSWFNPETNTKTLTEFKTDLMTELLTGNEKVEFYRKASGYKIDEEPVYLQPVLNENGEKLMTLAIYRGARPFQPTSQIPLHDRIQYEIFAYEVNYDLLRKLFIVEDEDILLDDEVSDPTIRVKFYAANHTEEYPKTIPADVTSGSTTVEQYLSLSPITEYALADYDAVNTRDQIDYILRGQFYNQYYQTGTGSSIAEYNEEYKNFSGPVKVEVTAFISDLGEEGLEADNPVTTFTLDDFSVDIEDYDVEKYTKGNGASEVVERFTNLGYYNWLFKNYLWWIGLISLVGFGIFGAIFYITWTVEEENKKEQKKRKKRK